MSEELSLKAKLKKYAISSSVLLFILVFISFLTVIYASYWQRRILNSAIELYTEEEAKSFARLLLYDLAFDERIKKLADYEEQIAILSIKSETPQEFYPLGLKAIVRGNLSLPDGWLMRIASKRGYVVRQSEINNIKIEVLVDEVKKESKKLEDDLTARITFSDHLRGIEIRSKRSFTQIKIMEEEIQKKAEPKGELFWVGYPLFIENALFGNVRILVDRGRLIKAQTKMTSAVTLIQVFVAVLLFLSLLVSVYLWYSFLRRVENEIVLPVTDLSERMEQWEREELPSKNDQQNEVKRLTVAFEGLLERFNIQREQLIKAEKMGLMERIGAGLSHELNNALNPIKLRLDSILLEGGNASKDDLLALKEHTESARKTLKDLSAINPSKTGGEKKPVKPALWLSIARRLAEPQVPKKVELVFEYDDDEPVISGNEEILTEIALNLILNSKDGVENSANPFIKVSLTEQNGRAAFSVEDNGGGFPATYLERRFEPFFTTKAQGMGLGLFIVETYTKRVGGEIKLENKTEGGAKVTISFPLAPK